MAMSLGKLTILIGAGILGSVLAKEGRMPSVSDVLSGALKIALKPIKQNDSASAVSKPRNDALIAQVNSLRQELQLLASNRPVTIVTSSVTGGRRYGVIIVIVVIGYGYIWWKGWKLPDFMFATRRALLDACNSVAKQLEQSTKRDLAAQIDNSSRKFDDIVTMDAATRDETTELRGEVTKLPPEIQSIGSYIRTLDSPSSSSRSALEQPQIRTFSRAGSLPLSIELPSPSASNGSPEAEKPLRNATSVSGLKVSQGICGAMDIAPSLGLSNGNHVSPRLFNRSHVPQNTETTPTAAPELPPRQPNVRSTGVLSRTISVIQNFKF
ncbi:hypothetical protein Cgig2_027054 [Carnegiea gigantea]|uniref:DUF1664 domain-containing protein n=1 Tax=Carnegiea gigantea TaxID=171969 RepID=A0A9Q1KA52_9CARY|nr:hypothetical protein Cgig2_027054 [Carnegiea gigantea]